MSSTPVLHSSNTSTATLPVENMVDVTDFGHANDVRKNIYLEKNVFYGMGHDETTTYFYHSSSN